MTGQALAIDVHGMTKRFGERTVVDRIGLQVRRGEIFGFLGPNGSGKTTFIRMLCGLLRADEGSGTCLGYDVIRDTESIKAEVGYMTQRFSFYEDLSIAENLDFVARMFGVKNRREAVARSIERLGLAGRQRQLAGQLSGGWKQRLALAACLIHQPQLLLLDEPTAGVDPKARREFWGRFMNSPRTPDIPDYDPLYGRSRAMSPPGLHRLRAIADTWDGDGGHRPSASHDLVGQRTKSAPPRRGTAETFWRPTGGGFRQPVARQQR